ncbi:hypothetical protein [Streptomyces sp. A5-4]|uniref:hypothetical protein n=1 Tax=Streptomyces sp. A5-4 TaxID=3384771 RepID=UPI003DA9F1E0
MFAFHRLRSGRRASGADGRNGHHDCEQSPRSDRARVMIHALHSLGGDEAFATLA